MRELNDLEQLEQATLPAGASAVEVSASELPLREGWLALANLVVASDAAAEFDERAFLAKLMRAVENPAIPAERHGGRTLQRMSRPSPRGRWLLLLGALAASIVALVSAGVFVANQRWGQIAQPAGDEPGVIEPVREIADSPASRAAQDTASSWDDSLDDHIEQVNQSLYQLKSGASTHDRSWQTFSARLEEFGQEFEVDAL